MVSWSLTWTSVESLLCCAGKVAFLDCRAKVCTPKSEVNREIELAGYVKGSR